MENLLHFNIEKTTKGRPQIRWTFQKSKLIQITAYPVRSPLCNCGAFCRGYGGKDKPWQEPSWLRKSRLLRPLILLCTSSRCQQNLQGLQMEPQCLIQTRKHGINSGKLRDIRTINTKLPSALQWRRQSPAHMHANSIPHLASNTKKHTWIKKIQ